MQAKYVPSAEIENRISRLQNQLIEAKIDAALIIYKMDLFYFSGTAQNASLFVPAEGKPLLMVVRDIDRARKESPLPEVAPLDSVLGIPDLVQEQYGRIPHRIGLELDVVPVRDYLRYQRIFPKAKIVDSAGIIKKLRMIKSFYEVAQMKRAGEIGKIVYEKGRDILREGMSEIEFGGWLELEAKKLEHEGLLRVRSLNYEAYTWHVLSGPSGSIVSQAESPMGGAGLSPAFPVGAGTRKIQAHEPVLVDFGICYNGYIVDQTRIYCIGDLPEKYVKAYEASCKIEELVLDGARPGASAAAIFEKTVQYAKELGYDESYLGIPGRKTTFVAHGVGLEINEIPFIAKGQNVFLEDHTTIAIEPKMVFSGEGAVGIENTVLITDNGVEKLTTCSEEILQI
ncbi:MAG: aminopeptidase P family protein [Deltaproteobacteria bacterium]|nr:aminopeptidase P family protein [Deltaproteobacteria bacterium]